VYAVEILLILNESSQLRPGKHLRKRAAVLCCV